MGKPQIRLWILTNTEYYKKGTIMKITIKHILSIIGLICFLFLAVGSTEDSDSSSSSSKSSSSSSSSSRKSENTYNEEKVCQDAYGNWHSQMSTCSTCGTSYCVEYLPYGEYCSQGCCAAYEGLSSKCGY